MKDTLFWAKRTMNCRGRIVELNRPYIMGILNLSPDSFFDGNRHDEEVVTRVRQMLTDGADIIDIGGQSTRPGAEQLSSKEELALVIPALKTLRKEFPDTIFSVDTYKGEVAKQSMLTGADIINDISGGGFDPEIWEIAAQFQCPYVLTHIQGTPQTMQDDPQYKDIMQDVLTYFAKKVEALTTAGIRDVIIDPGFGFGKTMEHNYTLLKHLDLFHMLERPILAGISRKSMIYKLLNTTPEQAIHGTSAAQTIALLKGAGILRVHDVKVARDLIDVVEMTQKA